MREQEGPKVGPKYRRIAGTLRTFTEAGIYPPGSKLKSMPAYTEIFRTDPLTMRRAVNLLVDDGVLEWRKKIGIFVRQTDQELSELQGEPEQTLQQWFAANLLAGVVSGEYTPGGRIGTLQTFQDRYVISRNTALLGVRLLPEVLEARRGSGEKAGIFVQESLPPEDQLADLVTSLGQTEQRPFGLSVDVNRQDKPEFHPATLTTDKSLPLQIAEDLGRSMDSGIFNIGDMLPPISVLVNLYSVSRDTVRDAYDLLTSQGRIAKRQGSGTFVTNRKSPQEHDIRTSGEQTIGQWTAARLLAAISTNYPPGRLLPSEAQLMEELGVSRRALRDGLQILATNGIVDKKQGVGTVVRNTIDGRKLRTIATRLGQADIRPAPDTRPHREGPLGGKISDTVEDLRSKILTGTLPDGTTLRRDNLVVTYQVSDGIARRCLQVLTREGLLDKEQGWNYSIRRPTVPVEFPTASGELLPFTRKLWNTYGHNEGWTGEIIQNADQLIDGYSAQRVLTDIQRSTLFNLARMLSWYGVCTDASFDTVQAHFTQAAPILLEDLNAILPWGGELDESAKVVMWHNPSEVNTIVEEYQTNPFVFPLQISQALNSDDPRSFLEEAMRATKRAPEIPTEPAEILTFSRLLWRMRGRSSWKDSDKAVGQQLLEEFYETYPDLTDIQRKALQDIGRVLSWYATRTEAPAQTVQERFNNAAPLLLEELREIQALGVYGPEIVIMRQAPASIRQLFADYQDDRIINRSDILVAVRSDYFPGDRIATIKRNVVALQNESNRGARRFLYAVKKAARLPEPHKMIDDIDKALDEARRKYGGSRFVSTMTILEYCVSGVSTWDDQIREHIERCNDFAQQYRDVDEVTDRIVETYSRSHRDSTRIITAIEDFRVRFNDNWQRFQGQEELDRDTFITIAEYFNNNIPFGVNLWLERYPRFKEQVADIAEPYLIKDFVARTLRRGGSGEQLVRGFLNYIKLFRGELPDPESTFEDRARRGTVIYQAPAEDSPETINRRREQLRKALEDLSYDELQAVQMVYGLEGLASDWSTQEVTVPTQEELESTFGTDDLTNYVDTVILPKIQKR